MNPMNPDVDFYFDKAKKWQEEMRVLRRIVLGCGLTEELKWGVPGYTRQKKNVVLIHAFKDYCAILFVKGALLQDSDTMLVQQTDNTQTTRQIRFTSMPEITGREAAVTAYVYEAIEVEKAGLTVTLKQTAEFDMPDEFRQKLAENPALKTAFETLTPGRQRAYLLHFSAPRQAKTREARVEKCIPRILAGIGLNG
jgi:uncharacterized protein YdeI (YjbR/CyaY-like superfamily)